MWIFSKTIDLYLYNFIDLFCWYMVGWLDFYMKVQVYRFNLWAPSHYGIGIYSITLLVVLYNAGKYQITKAND